MSGAVVFWVLILCISLPPLVLVASLVALDFVAPDRHERRSRWRRLARTSGILSLGSVLLAVFLVYALGHLD